MNVAPLSDSLALLRHLGLDGAAVGFVDVDVVVYSDGSFHRPGRHPLEPAATPRRVNMVDIFGQCNCLALGTGDTEFDVRVAQVAARGAVRSGLSAWDDPQVHGGDRLDGPVDRGEFGFPSIIDHAETIRRFNPVEFADIFAADPVLSRLTVSERQVSLIAQVTAWLAERHTALLDQLHSMITDRSSWCRLIESARRAVAFGLRSSDERARFRHGPLADIAVLSGVSTELYDLVESLASVALSPSPVANRATVAAVIERVVPSMTLQSLLQLDFVNGVTVAPGESFAAAAERAWRHALSVATSRYLQQVCAALAEPVDPQRWALARIPRQAVRQSFMSGMPELIARCVTVFGVGVEFVYAPWPVAELLVSTLPGSGPVEVPPGRPELVETAVRLCVSAASGEVLADLDAAVNAAAALC